MKRTSLAIPLGGCLFTFLAASSLQAGAQSAVTEQEAHAIAIDAYLYFYPLVTMDVTRKQFTNIEPGIEFGKGPMNMFTNVPEYTRKRGLTLQLELIPVTGGRIVLRAPKQDEETGGLGPLVFYPPASKEADIAASPFFPFLSNGLSGLASPADSEHQKSSSWYQTWWSRPKPARPLN